MIISLITLSITDNIESINFDVLSSIQTIIVSVAFLNYFNGFRLFNNSLN